MRDAGFEPQWLPHPLLGGSHLPLQEAPHTRPFLPALTDNGPREFIESFLTQDKSPQYNDDALEDTVEDSPLPAPDWEIAGEAEVPAPQEMPLSEVWQAGEPMAPFASATPPEDTEPAPVPPVAAQPAPQPVLAVPAAMDEQLLARERKAGFEAGLEAGLASARAQMQQEIEGEKAAIRELLGAIQKSMADTRQFFAPLQRLAVHLAEQLVRGELTLSGQAIRRLVENCLMEFEHRGEGLVLRLNPLDLEKFSSLDGELSDSVELVGDAGLGRGSVRIEMADGVIEDLIEHRLAALAKAVLGDDTGTPFVRKPGRPSLYRRHQRADAAWDQAGGEAPADPLRGDANENDLAS